MSDFDFKATLVAHPQVRNVQECPLKELPKQLLYLKEELSFSYRVTATIDATEYDLLVSQPKDFPADLPYVHLASPESHDYHNHVNSRGDVCYLAKVGEVLVNTENPVGVLHQALERAFDVIASRLDGDLTHLYEEFEGYWHSLPNIWGATCFFPPPDTLCKVNVGCNPKDTKNKMPEVFLNGNLPVEYGYSQKINKLQFFNGWHIPLVKWILPPLPGASISLAYVRELFEFVPAQELKKLKKQLLRNKNKSRNKKRITKQYEYYLFSMPRPSGAVALFGVMLSSYSKKSFLLDQDESKWRVKPISIRHHYRQYTLERGGADQSLENKVIAIVGCGAVGSRIAEQIAFTGVGKLILVDDDIFSEDNLYRHVLGGEYLRERKVVALAKYLQNKLPFIEIAPISQKRGEWMLSCHLDKIDLIIDATADFTGIRELNSQVMEDGGPSIVYTWLEPCGIGGHCLYVNSTGKGCFECLLDEKDGLLFLKNHFLEPFQNIAKDLSGCGGAFTPYSSLDAVKTATLATEIAINCLKNRQIESLYYFWRGDETLARSSNLRISKWYVESIKYSGEQQLDFIDNKCKVCS